MWFRWKLLLYFNNGITFCHWKSIRTRWECENERVWSWNDSGEGESKATKYSDNNWSYKDANDIQKHCRASCRHSVDVVLPNGKSVASLLCPIRRRRGKKCGSNGYFAHLFVLAYDVAYLLRSIAHFISFHFRMRIKWNVDKWYMAWGKHS